MVDLLKEDKSYKIFGAAIEVHKELGPGFLEAVYQEALAIELKKQGIPFEREKQLSISYKGIELNKKYRADFICFDNIIVEIKAIKDIGNIEVSQTINYLKATGFELALLANFGGKILQKKRVVLTE
jgi:GxxExxY protein